MELSEIINPDGGNFYNVSYDEKDLLFIDNTMDKMEYAWSLNGGGVGRSFWFKTEEARLAFLLRFDK